MDDHILENGQTRPTSGSTEEREGGVMVKKTKTKPQSREVGYKGHFAGSRKEAVHKTFDRKGRDAAVELGAKLGLKEGTLKGWVADWKRAEPKSKPKAKPAPKKKANGTAAVAAS